MENEFSAAPKPVLTVLIDKVGEECVLQASCTNLAGEALCSVRLAKDDVVAKLQSMLCERLSEANACSRYNLLTAERNATLDNLQGCYQHHTRGHRPAGYSSSGALSTYTLILEPGKAGL